VEPGRRDVLAEPGEHFEGVGARETHSPHGRVSQVLARANLILAIARPVFAGYRFAGRVGCFPEYELSLDGTSHSHRTPDVLRRRGR